MIALASTELFRILSPGENARLTRAVQERAFDVGQEIFREGDPGDGLYVVSEGLVEISGILSGEQRQIFSQIRPGGVFGEMSVIEQLPRSACATAKSATRVLFISRAEMQAAIERSPALASELLHLVSHRLREFNQHYLREVVQAERLAAVGRFARSIVHDLKNPLNAISLTTELFSKAEASPEFRATAKARVLRQVGRIDDLITDILQFTQDDKKINLAPSHYARFIEEIVAELGPDLELKSVTLAVATPPPEIVLDLDKKLLRRVFANLAYNAVDALLGEGKIEFRFSEESGCVRTEIRDNGPGIAPEIGGRLFQPFATHGKTRGSGLGLSICKKIVEDHGGKISAHNDPAGGAVFSFTLPAANRD